MGPGDDTKFTIRRAGEDAGEDAGGGGEEEGRGEQIGLLGGSPGGNI